MSNNWSLELGLIPGVLFGIRSYPAKECNTHVLYFGCIDIALIVYNDEDEE
tara:strand:+ start:1899 stop:2051 length:153 start_codon:yes stop_codon:yes gene_type:complete